MDELVIDPAVYAALQATVGAEFAAELVDTFIEEATGMLAELRSARSDSHADRFRRAAHCRFPFRRERPCPSTGLHSSTWIAQCVLGLFYLNDFAALVVTALRAYAMGQARFTTIRTKCCLRHP